MPLGHLANIEKLLKGFTIKSDPVILRVIF